MKKKIIVLKKGKKIFQLHIKPSKKSKLGDFDIMIEPGENMYFEHLVLGNYFKHYKLPEYEIRYISWHGYYETIGGNEVYAPVVNIKSHGHKIDTVRHLGSINSMEPFAFPVCSLYIPKGLSTEKLGLTEKYENNIYIDTYDSDGHKNVRIDFFVLPKSISIDRFKKSPIMLSYHFADLEIFNKPEKGYNILLDAEIEYYNNLECGGVFVRIVKDTSNLDYISYPEKIFNDISDYFSLVINDPNDIYNKLANFYILEYENGKLIGPKSLKGMHEENIEFKDSQRLKIWD